MNKNLKLIVFISLIVFACTNEIKGKLIGTWKVTKMEKVVNVTSVNRTLINNDINPKMSYTFMPDNKVIHISQIGSKLKGFWYLSNKTISIKIGTEIRDFKIKEFSDNKITLTFKKFILHLEK